MSMTTRTQGRAEGEMPFAPPFPIIVGRGRSGTTLLRAMLTSHPELAIPPESHFLVSLARRRRRYEAAGGFDAALFQRDLSANWGFRRWEVPEEEVAAALADARPAGYAEAVRAVYRLYAARQRKARYGDKTPIYVLHIPLLAGLFPESKFIHLVRDGRDVALSYLDANFGPRTVGAAALYWRRFVEEGRRAGRTLEPGRYLELRYEDLLAEPERAVRLACEFIGIGFDAATLRYFEDAERILAGNPHDTEHRNIHLPPTRGLRDWRRQMSRDDVAVFEAIAGDLLADLGYERVVRAPSVRVRARAGLEWLAVQRERLERRTLKAIGRDPRSNGQVPEAV